MVDVGVSQLVRTLKADPMGLLLDTASAGRRSPIDAGKAPLLRCDVPWQTGACGSAFLLSAPALNLE